MVSLKRQIYGLPFMGWYRTARAEDLAKHPRATQYGFTFSSIPMYWNPNWEAHERAVVDRLLPKCRAFIDVGANHGFYSLVAAANGLDVVAVEPEPGNLLVLSKNVARNSAAIEICPKGLSDHEGAADFFGDGDMGSLLQEWQGLDSCFRRQIELTTLDGLISGRWSGEQLFIKIDVEGVEDAVLRGAIGTIARDPKPFWMIETFPDYPNEGHREAFLSVFRTMFEAGYVCSAVENDGLLTMTDAASWKRDPALGSNFLFRAA